MASSLAPALIGTPDIITRFVEHECQDPAALRDFVGEVKVVGVWDGFEFTGYFKCPSCGMQEDFFESFNPDNEDY